MAGLDRCMVVGDEPCEREADWLFQVDFGNRRTVPIPSCGLHLESNLAAVAAKGSENENNQFHVTKVNRRK